MQGDSATLTPTLAADNLNPSLGKTCNTATVAGEGARGDLTNPVEEAETRRPLWSEVLGAHVRPRRCPRREPCPAVSRACYLGLCKLRTYHKI